MGGASSYWAMLAITGFLSSVWTMSKISRAIGISSVVLEISVGLLFSPQLLKLMPGEYAECEADRRNDCTGPGEAWDRIMSNDVTSHYHCDPEDYIEHRRLAGDSVDFEQHQNSRQLGSSATYASFEECIQRKCELEVAEKCGLTPGIFVTVGHAGVALMIFESGMHFDFETAKVVGPKACIVAVFGTFLPLISGTLLIMAFGYDFMNGIASGTALAPTSIGIALKLLHEAKCLHKEFGQAIITAAFVDDILSLMLFNVLFSLGDEFSVFNTVIKPIIAVAFMILAGLASMRLWPYVLGEAMKRLPEGQGAKASHKLTRKESFLLLVMFCVLVVYSAITHLLGTHLWGCFIAGMSFACLKSEVPAWAVYGNGINAHHLWSSQTKRITIWTLRIFFAVTVAFSIPVNKLLDEQALLYGSLMGIGPCILAKVLCAPCMGAHRWVVGWAMVGRAEFAYLIAQMAFANNMMQPEVFAIVIWALLWATIFAPFIFRIVLRRFADKHQVESEVESAVDQPCAPCKAFSEKGDMKERCVTEIADCQDFQSFVKHMSHVDCEFSDAVRALEAQPEKLVESTVTKPQKMISQDDGRMSSVSTLATEADFEAIGLGSVELARIRANNPGSEEPAEGSMDGHRLSQAVAQFSDTALAPELNQDADKTIVEAQPENLVGAELDTSTLPETEDQSPREYRL